MIARHTPAGQSILAPLVMRATPSMRPFTQASLHRTAHLPSGPALPLQTLPRPSYTATKSPGTLKPAHVAAAAPAAAAPGSLIIRVATGVPLIEFFQSMTVAQAGVRAAMIIGATCALILLLNRLIVVLGDKLSKAVDPANTPEDNVVTELLSDAIKASERPVCVLLPLLGAAFCSTVLAAFGEVALERVTMGDSMAKFGGLSVDVLRNAAQLLQDTSEIVFIAFTAWFFLAFKQRIVDRIMKSAKGRGPGDEDNLARIVYPLSTLISWATVVASSLFSLHALGVDVQPLLALGSVSTLAIGFAAQSTVSNVLSAFSLYAARPFIAGDRVVLKSMSGATVTSGTVQRIAPMHTVIKTDAGMPIYIHNKDIAASLLVVNESKAARNGVTPALPSLDTTLTIRYQDVDKVAEVQRAATAWLKAHPDVMRGMPAKVAMQGFDLYGAVMSVKATLNREADSRKSEIFMEILIGIEKIVRENGAFLATQMGVGLPPPLQTDK